MSNLVRFGISLDRDLLETFDERIRKKNTPIDPKRSGISSAKTCCARTGGKVKP